MRTKILLGIALGVVACATATVELPPDEDGGTTTGDGSNTNCPQYDLTKDPKHCGSCTNACNANQVCSQGQCKAECDPPTTKCTTMCADLKTDIAHCGSCTKVCSAPDAGGMPPGTNNPEGGGLPYDGGPGWSPGMPNCMNAMCGNTCPMGMQSCPDGLCYDFQNHHDHCGDCNTACPDDTEWCNSGHCCALGQLWCNNACSDVRFDNNNCGACGKVCSGNTPYCANGTCVMACVPQGTRQGFNMLSSKTTTGCWNGNPCAQGNYVWQTQNGQSFINANEEVVCGGTTACVGHVGITTYDQAGNCQGSWDVYCNSTKVGTINTVNKGCNGDAMTNGCSITFNPTTCQTIKLVGITGSVGACCGSTGLHSMVTGVSAW